MKKILALCLFFALTAVCFSGCQNRETPPASDADVSLPTEDSETVPPAENPEPPNPQSPAAPLFERGEKQGKTYVSKRLGFSFTPAASWDMGDDIDLAELMDISVSEMNTLSLETHPVIYDMYAYDTVAKSDVMVCFEKLDLSAEEYSEQTKAWIRERNPEAVIDESVSVSLGGETYVSFRLLVSGGESGGQFSQTYCVRKLNDGVMAEIIVTAVAVSADEIFSWFETLPA